MVSKSVDDVAIGDRFICQVSNGDPNAIPGQKPGDRYYLRVVSVRKSRWYARFECDVENKDRMPIGDVREVTYRRDDRSIVIPRLIS